MPVSPAAITQTVLVVQPLLGLARPDRHLAVGETVILLTLSLHPY